MRICHLITSSAAAHYFESHARAASAAGHEMLVASLREPRTPPWVSQIDRIEYACLEVNRPLDYAKAFARLVALFRRKRIDVVQTHLFHATAIGVPAARVARAPLVIAMRHHIDDMLLAGAHLHAEIDRRMAQLADVIVTPSQAGRDYLVGTERHPAEKVQAINIGWDFDKLVRSDDDGARVRSSFGVPTSSLLLGCVARLSPNKGHVHLLESLVALRARLGDVRLLLVGDGDRPLVEQHVQRLGLADAVIFAGWRGDVAACFAAMDVLVLPSLSECFNQVIVEGMAVGVPVVATRVGGAAEVIEHGRSGLLVPARDADSITAAVLRLATDSEERRRLAAQGQASVRERFTAARMTAEQLACYERGLAARGHSGTVAGASATAPR